MDRPNPTRYVMAKSRLSRDGCCGQYWATPSRRSVCIGSTPTAASNGTAESKARRQTDSGRPVRSWLGTRLDGRRLVERRWFDAHAVGPHRVLHSALVAARLDGPARFGTLEDELLRARRAWIVDRRHGLSGYANRCSRQRPLPLRRNRRLSLSPDWRAVREFGTPTVRDKARAATQGDAITRRSLLRHLLVVFRCRPGRTG